MVAVTSNGDALEFASGEVKNDKEVVMAAIACSPQSISRAGDKMKADKEVMMAAVNLKDDPHGYALKYASNELKADKEFVMAAHDDEHNFNGHDEYNPMNLKWA